MAAIARRQAASLHASTPILAAEPSAELRDRLLAELAEIVCLDAMANWAQRRLPTKNTLGVADAEWVETAFREKLAALDLAQPEEQIEVSKTAGDDVTASKETTAVFPALANPERSPPHRRVSAKTIRLRDKDHRKFVSTQPCLVCGRTPADPHHLRFAQPRALSRKVSDEFTVPVCRLHHRELHNHGDEKKWWEGNNINPLPMAFNLWKQSQTENMAVLTRFPTTTPRIPQTGLATELNDCGGFPQAGRTCPPTVEEPSDVVPANRS